MRFSSLTAILLLAPAALFAQCRSEVTNAPLLRIEGQAESIGDLQFTCTANSNAPFDVTVTLSVPVATPLAGTTLQVSSSRASYTPVLDGPNRVRFPGVTLPIGIETSVRIFGLRANVSGLAYTLAAAPPVVHATVASSGYPLAASQVPVGYPTPSYSVALRTANGTPTTVLNLAASTTERSHELIFRESFPSAFQTRAREANSTQGTRLVAQFTNLPLGAAVAVSPLSGPSAARLITAESGPYTEVPFAQFVPLPVVNGTATAVWEVITEDPTRLETYSFGLIASGPAATASVTGRLGPADATSLPRFLATSSLAPLDCAVPCVQAPRALHFTRRFGQPPPATFQLPYFSDISTSQFSLRIVLDSPYQWLSSPGPGPTLQFSEDHLPPGRYTAYVETLPGRHQTWVVLDVLPAQPGAPAPLLCRTGAGVPSLVRAEGMAEPVTSIPIVCSGVPGSFVTATFSGSLNTFFASRILDPATSRSETLLTVGEPSVPTPGVDEFFAIRTDFFGKFEFRNVSFQIPSSGTIVLRISNLRVEAHSLSANANSFGGASVELSLTARGNLAMPATPFPIALIQPGVEFDVRDATDQFVPRITQPASYLLRFKEGFASAFLRRNVATTVDNPLAIADQGPVSNQFFTETMYYANSRGLAGLATQGTRLYSAISGLPPASRVFVTTQPLATSSGTARARLTNNFLESFAPVQASTAAPLFRGAALPMAELTTDYFNQRVFSWEILESSPFQTEEAHFGLVVTETAGGGNPITGSLGPPEQPVPLTYPRFRPFAPVTFRSCPGSDCAYVEPAIVIEQPANSSAAISHTRFIRTYGSTFRYFARSQASWLTIPEPIGNAPNGFFNFVTNPAGLLPGTYRTSILINGSTIPVTFIIPGTRLQVTTSLLPAATANRHTIYMTATHPVHTSQLGVINLLVNNALDGRQACYLAYSLPARALFLVNDAGPEAGLSPPLVPGSNAEIANSQCSVRGASSFVEIHDNLVMLGMDVTFSASWTGSKSVFGAARSADGSSTGWVFSSPLHLPESVSYPRVLPGVNTANLQITPAGTQADLQFVYEGTSSADDLETVWGLINTAVDARAACYFAYYVPGNLLFLYPDDGNGAEAKSILLAGNRTLSNSQCAISAEGALVQKVGRQLILIIPFRFPPDTGFRKGIWGAAKSLSSPQASPWRILEAIP